ncbi:MAG TPA: glycoside hydrolase family 3 N-terminal domain-containing protein, partial [Longimicrobiales bacterium]|nr:glycoside hydrolase family 3 N-terminal domain-containing protein [Longimicrobiales bacterium]
MTRARRFLATAASSVASAVLVAGAVSCSAAARQPAGPTPAGPAGVAGGSPVGAGSKTGAGAARAVAQRPAAAPNLAARGVAAAERIADTLGPPATQGPAQETVRREAFIDSLLSRMTLDEKLGQLNQLPGQWGNTGPVVSKGGEAEVRAGHVGSFLGVYGAGYTRRMQRVAVEQSRLHIPLLFAHDVIHGFRTIFPVPLAEASTWDPALVSRAARIAATEASAWGLMWTFAPMVDIARDPRWG